MLKIKKLKVRPPEYLTIKIIGTVALLASVFLVWLFKIPCMFLYLTHLPCPTCGMTRAVIALLHFDFSSAIFNNFMIFSLPILYIFFIYDFVPFKKQRINAAVVTRQVACHTQKDPEKTCKSATNRAFAGVSANKLLRQV
jgi:hypothetical protein